MADTISPDTIRLPFFHEGKGFSNNIINTALQGSIWHNLITDIDNPAISHDTSEFELKLFGCFT
ncbi:hypothetical protein D3C73_772720 [compost metagenome]